MKHFNKHVILIIILLSVLCCAQDNEKQDKQSLEVAATKKNKNVNLNISFLLDLSDRIDPKKYGNETMEYYKRDVAYIKSVSEAFNTHLRNKRVRTMNDRIQVFFEPEPKNPNINMISKDLKHFIDRNTASIELLNQISKTYSIKPQEIYELAIEDNTYVGSDTWSFFKNKVEDYCVEDQYRNILIILTDGYIYHKDNKRKEGNKTTYITPQKIRKFGLNKQDWEDRIKEKGYGFISATKNLNNLEILVLGINADTKNTYEEEVIKYYWREWFKEMGVARFQIKNADLPSNMDKIIKDFILIN